MGKRLNGKTLKIVLGALGLAFVSVGVQASDLNPKTLHIQLHVDSSAALGDMLPENPSVSIPRISGVELFSNQAVFSFGRSSFSENTPLSSIRENADEASFWRSTVITDGSQVTIGTSLPSQTLASQMLSASNLNAQPTTFTFDGTTSSAASSVKKYDFNALPALTNFGDSANNTTTATSLNSAAKSASLVGLANPELSSDVVHSLLPPNAGLLAVTSTPEPVSLGMVGLAAVGLLGRRRATR